MGAANSIVKVVSGSKEDFDRVKHGKVVFTVVNGVVKRRPLKL